MSDNIAQCSPKSSWNDSNNARLMLRNGEREERRTNGCLHLGNGLAPVAAKLRLRSPPRRICQWFS